MIEVSLWRGLCCFQFLSRNSQNMDSRPACDHCAKDFKQYGTVGEREREGRRGRRNGGVGRGRR